ncbi:cytochrome b561 and DOMON domain-containing protein At3g25290-like [Curcuma longa]|uniref:cytochrome b561 and DOMON domain-containing protein At3g25290-like n=1 Tax=Curcuma longa TaxID=136217 RepID=UPI003D9F2029
MKQGMVILCLLLSLMVQHHHQGAAAQRQSCVAESFSGNELYSSCNSLPYLGASLHWTYHPSNATADVAFRAPQTADGWVAWAINPNASGMLGAQSFLAFPASNGAVTLFTTAFSTYALQPSDVKDENLTFAVYDKRAEYGGGYYTIYATLALPSNSTRVNTVWQASTQIQDGVPYGHAAGDNELSKTSLDLLSGEVVSAGGNSRLHRKNIHGVLNAISWGILMPIGAMIARYVKVFESADPAWTYLHVACQFSAYVIGVTGWGLGLKLGSESVGITYHKHRDIAVALFSLATVQVFALLMRPNKEHKYRVYWNVYHHSMGYCIITLGVVNIFKGFDILAPAKKWKHAYAGSIVTLAGIALVLELLTWGVVLRRRSRSSKKPNGYVFSQDQVL